MDERSEFQDTGEDISRVGALSDGVFGVALTLLVLELRLPETVGGVPLAQAVFRLWPKLWSYALTFAVVGAFWISHHRMLRHIARYDRALLWLNLLFLSLIALVPFPTSLIGRFDQSLADARVAWIMYALDIALIGFSLFWLWRYALAHGLTDESISRRLAGYLGARALVAPAVFFVSILVCLVTPPAAYFTPILILPAMRMVGRAYSRVE